MLTIERVRYLFRYDGETGRLVRMVFEKPGEKPVTEGVSPQGYYVRWVDKKCYLEHVLVYFWHTGSWVPEIDHWDRNKSNNRIENLRPCTRTLNNANQGIRCNNTSGYRGVSRKDSKWLAQISVNKVHYRIGIFSTPELAALAYNRAAVQHFGDFAYINEVQL